MLQIIFIHFHQLIALTPYPSFFSHFTFTLIGDREAGVAGYMEICDYKIQSGEPCNNNYGKSKDSIILRVLIDGICLFFSY